jgi:hypothetical protein
MWAQDELFSSDSPENGGVSASMIESHDSLSPTSRRCRAESGGTSSSTDGRPRYKPVRSSVPGARAGHWFNESAAPATQSCACFSMVRPSLRSMP